MRKLILALILFSAGCVTKGEYQAFVDASEHYVIAVGRPAQANAHYNLAATVAATGTASQGRLQVVANLDAAEEAYEQAILEAKKRLGEPPTIDGVAPVGSAVWSSK